jgi:hypothetical protein
MREHPEFLYGAAGCLVMDCPNCGDRHYRNGIDVLEYGKDEHCVSCASVLEPVLENGGGN